MTGVLDIYVGHGDVSPTDVIIVLDNGVSFTLDETARTKLYLELDKQERILKAIRREKRAEQLRTDPKVPCPGLGFGKCSNLKPLSAGICDVCQAEYNDDPEAFK